MKQLKLSNFISLFKSVKPDNLIWNEHGNDIGTNNLCFPNWNQWQGQLRSFWAYAY